MKTKVNQVKAGAVLNYVQLFLGVIISLVVTPFIIRGLGQSEYGIYNLSASTTSYLSLLTLGIGGAYLKFNMKYRVVGDVEGEQRLNATFMVIYIVLGVITALVGTGLVFAADFMFGESLTADEIYKTKIVMALNIANMAIALPFSVFQMNINAYEKFVFAKLVTILNTVVSPAVRLPIVLLGGKAIEITIAMTAISILTCVIQMIYALTVLKMGFKFGRMDKKLVWGLFSFSFFIFLNQLIDMINWSMDKFILGVVSGTAVVAIYTVGATFNTYTMQFSTAISSVLAPRAYKLVESGADKKEIDEMFIKMGRIQFVLVAFIITAFVFFGKPFIVNIYADESYIDAYYIGILLIVPLIVPLIQNIGLEIQRAMNKHKFRSIVYIGIAIANLAMSIPLAMKFGGIGSAIGTCVSLLIGNGLIMNIYYDKGMGLNIKKFWWNILKFLPGLILPIVVGTLLMIYVDMSNMWVFLGYAVLYTVVYGLSMFFIGMNKYEKGLFLKPVKKILNKIFKKKAVAVENVETADDVTIETENSEVIEDNIELSNNEDKKNASL